MRSGRTRGAWLVLVAVMAAGPASADQEKAREAFRHGIVHYNLAEYREALQAFKEAYREYNDPTLLFNIGQCHRQMNDRQMAVRFFRNYLRELPQAPNAKEVKGLIVVLERELAAMPQKEEPEPSPEPSGPPIPLIDSPPLVVSPEPVAGAPTTNRTPIYKRWWLWTAVGVVVAGAAVGLGVGLAPVEKQATLPAVHIP